jgi:hypothetical protein
MLIYFVPVLAIVGVLFYTRWAQANVKARAARGEGPQMFHDAYASRFEVLLPDERVIGLFSGLAYTKQNNTMGEKAGALAKEAALGAVGMQTFVPVVFVGVTTHGRVLVSEEYAEMGSRNNFKVVGQFPPGTHVQMGQQAYPQHQGDPPKNPYSKDAPLELVRLVGAGEQYLCWLNGAGAIVGASSFVSISTVLPITAERALGMWTSASQPAAA